MKQITSEAIALLNEALWLDPDAISKLIHFRVLLNDALVASDLPLITNEQDEMGLLGFLNGLFKDPDVRIAAVVDDQAPDTCLIREFVAVDREIFDDKAHTCPKSLPDCRPA